MGWNESVRFLFNSVSSKIILNSPKVFWNGKNLESRNRKRKTGFMALWDKILHFLKQFSVEEACLLGKTILRWFRTGMKVVAIGHNSQYKLLEHPFAQLSTKNPVLRRVANGVLNCNKILVIIKTLHTKSNF